jgi:DNA replication protein DnaC
VGKTHLAVAIARAKLLAGKRVLFISVSDYLNRLKDTFNKIDDAGRYTEMMDLLKKEVDCLVLDDLGVEKPTAWSVERLYDIINTRFDWSLQTIITTNFANTQEMAVHLSESPVAGERIASRLLAFGWVHITNTPDYRQKIWTQR